MKVRVFNARAELVPVVTERIVKSDAEWREMLTRTQYVIARNKGTEPPFCGNLLDNKHEGVYCCVCCGLPLFASNAKFNSGTGWPSFFKPIAEENVATHDDDGHGMTRTEILCARCDGHLGHVFTDGPAPTRLRFCVNSDSLRFVDEKSLSTLADPAAAG
jgi:methionine-R-sulfoxide reductase